MKGRNIFIAFIVTIILGVSAILSMVFVDKIRLEDLSEGIYMNLEEDEPGLKLNKYSYKVYEKKDLGDIKKISCDDFIGNLEIKKGANGLDVYAKKEDLNLGNYFSYEVKGDTLELKTKPASENDRGKDKYKIVLSQDKPEDLEIEMKSINGVIDVKDKIKSLKSESINGVINIDKGLESLKADSIDGVINTESASSFDIEIGSLSGVIDFEFDKLDAEISIDKVYGFATIDGESLLNLEDGNSFRRRYGDGRKKIKIGDLSGMLTIND